MSEITHERIRDEIDMEVLDPLWPELDGPSDRDASVPTRRPNARRLRVVGFVVAAAVAGSVATHWFEPRARAHTPAWTTACQQAIDATAHLHRLQARQLAQGMEEAFALIGGAGIADPTAIDAPLNARLQREAADATSRCISPTTPQV